MKALAAGIGAVVLSPLLLGGAAMAMASSSEAAAHSAALCLPGVDTGKVTAQVTKLLDGADASHVHVKGLELPGEQIPNAQTVVATGISQQVPRRGQVIALATALQESQLRNLSSGDRDSLGLFQQRPSQGWGTAEQIRDPAHASQRFYTALLSVHGWRQMTVAQAAQAVQKSGYPEAYAHWEPLATALQKAIAATFPDHGHDHYAHSPVGSAAGLGCGAGESSLGEISTSSVPKGYVIPQGTDPQARKAIIWALQQLGTMYQWGGSCTAARGPDPMGRCDCSSLMQQAYRHAGIRLTRTTYTQVAEGKAVSPQSLKPGDLLFSRGSAAVPEHVAMYLGELHGRGLLVEAPRTGKPVRLAPLQGWGLLTARRVT